MEDAIGDLIFIQKIVAAVFAALLAYHLSLAAFEELKRIARCYSLRALFLTLLCFAVTVHVCGTKPQTNDVDSAGGPLMMAPAPIVSHVVADASGYSMPTNMQPVTNLCFWLIARHAYGVSLGLAFLSGMSFVNDRIDIYGSPHLTTNEWTRFAQVPTENILSNAVVNLPFADFPVLSSWTNGFLRLADQSDTDGDTLTDMYERWVTGTNTQVPDTDGDGLTDAA